jgi:large subunit ribosomal protein L9
MKVILLNELKGRGGEGDVIDVATGYAVNFLFPRKIAVAATSGNLKQLEQRKHNIAKREATRLDTADKLLAALEGQKIRVTAKVGEEGQLFGSITPIQVAEAIKATFDVEVDRRRIDLHGLIKTAGEHSATVSIYRDLKANIVIEVVDEKLPATEPEGAEDVANVVVNDEVSSTDAPFDVAESVESQLESVAETLAAAVDATEGDDTNAVALADAAVEVLQDVEAVIDGAIAEAEPDAGSDVDAAAEEIATQ